MPSKIQNLIGLVVCLAVLATPHPGKATTAYDEMDDLLDLSLEELMDIDVYTTSKTPAKVSKAPGTVYAFNGDYLYTNGIATLEDLLRRVPGVQLHPYRGGHTSIWFRGVQQRYNSKILLMIDGVPLEDKYFGNFPIDEFVPVEHIDKVEILLGPGGVVHGGNAFAGVISITTRRNINDLHLQAGSVENLGAATHLNHKKCSLFVKYFEQWDGFQPEKGSKGKDRVQPPEGDKGLYMLDFKANLWENLTLSLTKTRYDVPLPYSKYRRAEAIRHAPWTASLNFSHGDLESLKLDATAYFVDYELEKNRYRITSSGTAPDKNEYLRYNTKYFGGDAYVSKRIQSHTLLAGASIQSHQGMDQLRRVEYDWDSTPGFWEIDDTDDVYSQAMDPNRGFVDGSVYLQDQWAVTDRLEVSLGTRYEIPEDFDEEWNFRSSAVYDLGNDLFCKALFGTASRTPTYREYRKADDEGPKFDPTLAEEHLRTYELAIGQNKKGLYNWLMTAFYNKYTNFITEFDHPTISDEVFQNNDETVIRGIELSGNHWFIDGRLRFGGGMTFLEGFDKGRNEELNAVSEIIGFMDFDYIFNDTFRVGLTLNFTEEPHTDSLYQTDSDTQNSNLNKSYVILGGRATYTLNEKIQIQLIGRNITDKHYYVPHYASSDRYDYEMPGAEFILRGRCTF